MKRGRHEKKDQTSLPWALRHMIDDAFIAGFHRGAGAYRSHGRDYRFSFIANLDAFYYSDDMKRLLEKIK